MARSTPPGSSDSPPDGADGGRKAILLRLPPELLRELRTWADQELRSLNGQLEFLLRDAVQRRHRSKGPSRKE